MKKTSSSQPRLWPASRGVLLVALGASEYGMLAANLAASIRISDRDTPIHLVYSGDALLHLPAVHRALFSSIAECPEEYYTRKIKSETQETNAPSTTNSQPTTDNRQPATDHRPPTTEYIKVKTHLYDLSPYEETLYLDVDLMLFPHTVIGHVLSGLSASCDYTIKNRGYENLRAGYTHWFNVEDVRTHYKTCGRLYQTQSEFIFFKKNKKIGAFFKKVKEVFESRPVAGTDFRGGVSDEYAYNIAMALTETYPHVDAYIPIFWHYLEGNVDWNKYVVKNHLGFSLGGEMIPDWITNKVNAYKQLCRQSLGLPHLFNVPPKKRWSAKKK